MTYKIIIFGSQGAGKGTQAEKISAKYGLYWVSTGKIFRREIERQSELGKQAEVSIKAGKLVPDEITNQVVKNRIMDDDCQSDGYILDGYPRNLSQAEFLDKLDKMTHIFNIMISDEEATSRMMARRICPKCGEIYNLNFKLPEKEGICDICGTKLEQRHDDAPEAIKERLKIYHSETEPIFDFYREKGIFHDIDGEREIVEVWKDIEKILDK